MTTYAEPRSGTREHDAGCRVPAELALLIFERADRHSLLACSLASRAWFRLARLCLLKTTVWRLRPDHFWVPDGGAPPVSGLECLLRFLENSPDACPLIHDLALGLECPSATRAVDWTDMLQRPGTRGCQLETLFEILGLLKNLHTLKIDEVPFDATHFDRHPPLPSPGDSLLSLSRLEISAWKACRRRGAAVDYDWDGYSSEAELRLFYRFLGHFAEIQEVVLDDVRIPRAGDIVGIAGNVVQPLPWHLPLKIHTLTVTNIGAFGGLAPLQRVDTLAFPAPAMSTPQALLVCPDMLTTLAGVRQHLRHVTLDIDGRQRGFHSQPSRRYGDLARMLGPAIGAMPALHTLELCATLHHRPSDDGQPLASTGFRWRTYDVVVGMARALAPSLRAFALLLRFDGSREVAVPLARDWSELDVALAESIARGLRKVEFADLDRQPLSDEERGLLRSCMHITWSTGAVDDS